MSEVIDENDLGGHIRYRYRISAARWSSDDKLWTLRGDPDGHRRGLRLTAGFLWMCQGYYRHSQGYTPRWSGMADFEGRIVHPQEWPEDLDYAGKNVVVIGSGATAATLIPAIAADCGHVTMLQRSPTYFRTGRNAVAIADELRELDIDETWIHEIVRKKILHDQAVFTSRSFTEPEVVKRELLAGVRAQLGARLRYPNAFHAELSALAPTHRLYSRRRSARSDPRRQGVSCHRRNREIYRDRHPSAVRENSPSRHHRDGHRFQSQCARRHRLRDRRQAARLLRHRHLSRHDVYRRSQHGVGVRVFPSQLDPACRSGRRFRLPVAQSYEGEGRAKGNANPSSARPGHAVTALDRSWRTSIPAI